MMGRQRANQSFLCLADRGLIMEKIIVGAGSGAGYVRACFSGRARGHAVALDLLRAHLRGAAMRRRLAVAFSGYLVSEPEECEKKLWRDLDGRPVLLVPTGGWCFGLLGKDAFSSVPAADVGALDAPEWLPAGSVRRHELGDQYAACAEFLARGGRA